eukprot:COSAG04_NODE_2120_length_4749_cov_110.676559_2_plen_224_part_00
MHSMHVACTRNVACSTVAMYSGRVVWMGGAVDVDAVCMESTSPSSSTQDLCSSHGKFSRDRAWGHGDQRTCLPHAVEHTSQIELLHDAVLGNGNATFLELPNHLDLHASRRPHSAVPQRLIEQGRGEGSTTSARSKPRSQTASTTTSTSESSSPPSPSESESLCSCQSANPSSSDCESSSCCPCSSSSSAPSIPDSEPSSSSGPPSWSSLERMLPYLWQCPLP